MHSAIDSDVDEGAVTFILDTYVSNEGIGEFFSRFSGTERKTLYLTPSASYLMLWERTVWHEMSF